MEQEKQNYNNNPNLKAANIKTVYTQEQLSEYVKCVNDPIYFIKTYMKIVSLDKGIINFNMYPYQEQMVNLFHKNRFVICRASRQSGKTISSLAYILWFVLFNPNQSVAILANKGSTARDLLDRLKFAAERLPKFLQCGTCVWNKGFCSWDNGSKILAAATSSSAVRGGTYSLLFTDEFAFVPNNIQAEFFQSVYPTIISGKDTKVIISSTPKGINNLFYKMWTDAVQKRNTYIPFDAHWSLVPGRDEKWKKETIANIGETQFAEEFETSFLGSQNTLISPNKLSNLAQINPIKKISDVDIYEMPEKNGMYVISVDTAHGSGQDYSAFTVMRVTDFPYKVVAKYYNNEVSPLLLPTIIYNTAKLYNNAQVLIEINDVGGQVANILHEDLEYEHILYTSVKGRAGQVLSNGFGTAVQYGVKMSKQVKKIGCTILKNMVEDGKLIFYDFDLISELSTFIYKANSYQADEGCHDDLVMTLVMFCWATSQPFFNQALNRDLRKQMYEEKMKNYDEEMMPFYIENGVDDWYNQTNGWIPVFQQ